jgi:hypothetical protein
MRSWFLLRYGFESILVGDGFVLFAGVGGGNDLDSLFQKLWQGTFSKEVL